MPLMMLWAMMQTLKRLRRAPTPRLARRRLIADGVVVAEVIVTTFVDLHLLDAAKIFFAFFQLTKTILSFNYCKEQSYINRRGFKKFRLLAVHHQ